MWCSKNVWCSLSQSDGSYILYSLSLNLHSVCKLASRMMCLCDLLATEYWKEASNANRAALMNSNEESWCGMPPRGELQMEWILFFPGGGDATRTTSYTHT